VTPSLRGAALPALLLLAFASASAAATPTLSLDQIHPGQKAVVKTVFTGNAIEDFDAEIVGILKGGRAEGDLIVARATSERVVKSGIAQGMSGSPVYVEGRLIGALSSGWSFTREPLFGVTPIGEMLAVLDQPSRPDTTGTAGPTGLEGGIASPGARVRYGELRWDDAPPPDRSGAHDDPAVTTTASPLPVPLGLPLACTGLHPGALAEARRLLEPLGLAVTPGGRAPAGGPVADSLRPGSAVAVDVMTGDLEVSAIGTLTWREGDRVLLFGHPLFQSGDVRLPLSTAEIVTIVASDLTSFKLGARGRPAGTLDQDRRTAMAGRIGRAPRLLPIAVEIGGSTPRHFSFATIEDRALAPQLVGLAALNSFMESGGGGGNQTVRWTLRLSRRDGPPLVLADVAAGEAPAAEAAGAIAAPLRFLFNSPYGAPRLSGIEVAMTATPDREEWTLRSARLLDAAVRPGGTLRVECEVERWHGPRKRVALDVPVPEEMPDGHCVLWLGGGPELSRYEATRLPGRYRPTSLADGWRRIGDRRPGDALYGTLFASAPEVTREERDYPELPVSALAMLAGGQSAGDGGRRGDAARLGEQRIPFAGAVRGELLLSVLVDSKAP